MFTHDFKDDLEFLWYKVETKQPFAFARYADGEIACIQKKRMTGADGWVLDGTQDMFGSDLDTALYNRHPDYYYGISCPCCDPDGHQFLKSKLIDHWDHVTYSNLFVNGNHDRALELLGLLPDGAHLIAPTVVENLPFLVRGFYAVDTDVVAWYTRDAAKILEDFRAIAKKYTHTLFLFCAGPLSEILIEAMWGANGNNMYVDLGSVLDLQLHGRPTRGFLHEDSPNRKKTCSFQ